MGRVDPGGEAFTYLSDWRWDAVRRAIRYWAERLTRTAKGYGKSPGGKNPHGDIDCSGAVSYVLYKAGVPGVPRKALTGWNSGEIYKNAGVKGRSGRAGGKYFWDKRHRVAFSIGNILYSPPAPRWGHVALVIDDGTNPRILESAKRYGGPHIHRLAHRWGSWSPSRSGAYFGRRALRRPV